MSDKALLVEAIPQTNEPLRIAVRRLRWFKRAFHSFTDACGKEIGAEFLVDDVKLAAIFVRWLEAIDRQKPSDRSKRRDFFEFAASLMLQEMTAEMPLSAKSAPRIAKAESAAGFWPEGYCATMFCLAVHSAAMSQEFHTATEIDPAIDDLRHWWSFKENALEDARFSAGFLQLLLGHKPNLLMPDVFRARLKDELG